MLALSFLSVHTGNFLIFQSFFQCKWWETKSRVHLSCKNVKVFSKGCMMIWMIWYIIIISFRETYLKIIWRLYDPTTNWKCIRKRYFKSQHEQKKWLKKAKPAPVFISVEYFNPDFKETINFKMHNWLEKTAKLLTKKFHQSSFSYIAQFLMNKGCACKRERSTCKIKLLWGVYEKRAQMLWRRCARVSMEKNYYYYVKIYVS